MASRARRTATTACAADSSGRASRPRRFARTRCLRRAIRELDDERAVRAARRAARAGERDRLVSRTHGIRSARARWPLDHRRPAQHEDAVGDESQDQVPRIVSPFAPSVLAERVGDYFEQNGASPYMLLVAPVREELRIPLTAEQQRCSASTSSSSSARSCLRSPMSTTRRASRPCTRDTNPRYYHAAESVRAAHRLRRARQHVVQRARRADRRYTDRRLSLLHAHRDGLSGHRELVCSTRKNSRTGKKMIPGKANSSSIERRRRG